MQMSLADIMSVPAGTHPFKKEGNHLCFSIYRSNTYTTTWQGVSRHIRLLIPPVFIGQHNGPGRVIRFCM